MLSTEESFTTDDLNPIFGIAVTDITLGTFSGLSGTTVVFTLVDENGVITEDTVVYRPLIKIKTQLDSSFFSSGEPYFFGGDGPNAYYYDSSDIIKNPQSFEANTQYSLNEIVLSNNQIYRVSNSNGGQSSVELSPETANASGFEFIRNWGGDSDTYFVDTFDRITGEVTTINDNFWERGLFGFSEKIQLSFVSLFGGVNWKGFFKATQSGTTSFRIYTTGSSIFKFQSSDSLSFQLARYGKPDQVIMDNFRNFVNNPSLLSASGITRYNLDQIQQILSIYDDNTRQLVQVRLPRKQRLVHNDDIFIEVAEGQLNTKKYTVLSHRTGSDDSNHSGGDERDLIYFFIEVTKDFNLLNVNVDTDLTVSRTGSDENLTTGNITEGEEDLEGLLCTIRYSPYKRREYKEYLNSTYHKLEIPQASFTTIDNTLTCDEFFYNHLMINDYIYDYRKRSTDGEQGVRRFTVVGLDDNTRTATVEIDSGYSIDGNDNNDQIYYLTPGSPDTIGSEEIDNTSVEIDEVYDSGSLSDTLDPSNTFNNLLFVGRYGEQIVRQKNITIDYFIDKFIDYAIDWYFYLKEEDINQNSNDKIWTIETKTTFDNTFRSLNFKYLYDINYDFFKIGDFKIFSENAISSSGTSRESGISQLTFGKPKILDKGDQYKILYSLLPVVSTYTPPLNYNKIAKSGNLSIDANSRLITTSSFTNFQVGNYVIINNDDGFLGTSNSTSLSTRTRVIEILRDDGIVVSKNSISSSSNTPYVSIDHRGFVCTCLLDTGSLSGIASAGASISITGQIDEIKPGMVLCIQSEPSRTTYCRITNISSQTPESANIKIDSDISNGTNIRAIIYQDKGVDIIEPLRQFCDGSVCGQNNYQGNNVKTKYISTIAATGARNDSLDVRWRESSLTNSYSSDDERNPHRRVYFPSSDVVGNTVDFRQTVNQGPSVAWWVDANVGQTIDDQAVQSNGVTNTFNFNTGARSKRYGSMQVWARFKKTGAGAYTTGIATAITEKYPSFPIDDTFWPIGIAEALVRVNGDLITNTEITNSHKYYFIVRVNEKIKSVPNAQNGYTATWTDSTTASDGSTLLPVTLDLTEFSTDKWDLREIVYTQGTDQNDMRDFLTGISSSTGLTSGFNNQFNNRTSSAYRDHYWRITSSNAITIDQTSAEDKFLNPNSLIRDDGNGNITYELRPGEILAHIGTTGYWTHFDTLESAVDTQVAFTYKPNPIDGAVSSQSANETDLINLFPGVGGRSVTFNNLGDKELQPRFMQYRNQIYEILPNPTVIENRFSGIRMINPNTTTTYTAPDGEPETVKSNLQNTTNALSVYTFTNTTDIRELCCPPLDTSPPFDSSEIGLSTTTSYPDMIIDGSVNIRSFSANHPTDKILPINTATTADLEVNEKLELLFGNTKYKLLIGDNIPNL